MQNRRDQFLADQQHDRKEDGELAEQDGDRARDIASAGRGLHAVKQRRHARQQHQHQHHGDVLHDQPADGDPPALGLEQPPLLQHPEQHHGARHRQRDAENKAGARRPAEQPADPHGEWRGDQALRHRAGDGDGPDRQQILEREMQPYAEHQQDDADLGELIGNVLVGDKAGGEGPDDDPCHEIADQRRQFEAVGNNAEGEREHQTDRDGGNEWRHMQHAGELLPTP